MEKVFVIGPGRWGSFIAWYLDDIGLDVTLYGIKGTPDIERIIQTRDNGIIQFPESMKLTCELSAIHSADTVVISINSQGLRTLARQLREAGVKNKTVILCMKGLEIDTGKRLSTVAEEELDSSCRVAVWIGPGHPQEFYQGIPNCMVIDSRDEQLKHMLADRLSSKRIRFYYGTDLVGNEVGAATKNVIGIAAGLLDGLGLSSLKGALMSRGTREISALMKAMGADPMSVYGLCHLGDYEATVFSKFSHNRTFGEMFAKGQHFDKLAEGCYTVKALMQLADEYSVELPICRTVYDVIYNGMQPTEAIDKLFNRTIKREF